MENLGSRTVQTRVWLRKPATVGLTEEIVRVAAVNEVILFGDFQNKEQLLAAVITEPIALQNQALAPNDQWTQNLDIDLYLGAKSLG
ncbi:MAG: TetR/AcrR family transcriptional regulator, partial [Nostoc sp.]